jgi:hypothetical protein
MPKEIELLMGKASHCFMFSQFQEAILILKDIIRKNPNYTEPYHLLGLMEGTLLIRIIRKQRKSRAFLYIGG